MPDATATAIAGSMMLWLVSGIAAGAMGVALAAGSLSGHRGRWLLARTVVNLTRGVPTSILVIAGGIFALRFAGPVALPAVFPGTHAAFQHVAWALVIALALGSAGHLAEIFRSGYEALGQGRRDEMTLLGLSRRRRLLLIVSESALVALPATGARFVHHLHNTAFAALFPVTDLFGLVLSQANTTFRVVDMAILGAGIYIAMSVAIWSCFKTGEALLRHGITGPVDLRRAVLQ